MWRSGQNHNKHPFFCDGSYILIPDSPGMNNYRVIEKHKKLVLP
jgi:hypothetical protein